MSIKSTRNISRAGAIHRIEYVSRLIKERDYKGIESISLEPDADIAVFVDTHEPYSMLDKWTNKMLEDVLDQPFFRFSMFDNYFVTDEED